jgi:hypothetical protein
MDGLLREVLEGIRACSLRARSFFIARNGVLTLAYDGWPAPIVALQRRLAGLALGGRPLLARLNPGAEWPKTTLSPLLAGCRLEQDELERLRTLCRDSERVFAQEIVEVPIERVSIVHMACRSLEEILLRCDFELAPHAPDADREQRDRAYIDAILARFFDPGADLGAYIHDWGVDENREPHYREPHVEATLVAFLPEVPRQIVEFRQAVESTLPGRYASLFGDGSLHITICGLVGAARDRLEVRT